jgi:hypothetical protein
MLSNKGLARCFFDFRGELFLGIFQPPLTLFETEAMLSPRRTSVKQTSARRLFSYG